ncbi:hypothetical protein BCE_1990 [Bacillus cereus ATCC 10987]|uniref:Uncharacterized protein n=1 Tax=Bacillus cereus (strain ATCC 10987 / NRS 248) TaxID=222523 RepID=Q739Z7_BACC1|nr:hypothetical protein BCE_1990 [Bacillus cereus ATCC 10987]
MIWSRREIIQSLQVLSTNKRFYNRLGLEKYMDKKA